MSKLQTLGFTGPFSRQADGSVNAIFGGHPYNIHEAETPGVWAALLEDQQSMDILIENYTPPPPPPPPDLGILKAKAIAKVRAVRAPVFASLAGLQSQSLANGDTDTAKAICGLQDSLKALPDLDLSECTDYASIEAAFQAELKAIINKAPASVLSAFKGITI